MPRVVHRHISLLGLLFFSFGNFLVSCDSYVPIWKGQRELGGYILPSTEDPITFEVSIDSIAPLMYVGVELEVLYDTYTGRDYLPLVLEISDEKGNTFLEKTPVKIPIREGQKWLGYPLKKNKEYIITQMVVDRVKLFPGLYIFQLAADNPDLPFLPGIVEIRVRFFQV
ncbi:MAG: hypothetical protein AAF694_22360 [Bacteroidota bacterium]